LEEMGFELLTPYDSHGGIVSFMAKDPGSVLRELLKRRISVSHRGGIRASTHFWNNKEDIDTLLNALGDI
ncbi:MAG: cysteine desulfurase, partial [Candidatus Methanofastidiosa archaeon]|nr:cysteine desulfurase [Candidatus Methanofastidiosa archaeon]